MALSHFGAISGLALRVLAVVFLGQLPSTKAQGSCMTTWLQNAGLPRTMSEALSTADLDEPSIVRTAPNLLAFVLANGDSSAGLERAGSLQNCIKQTTSSCINQEPCKNGGKCLLVTNSTGGEKTYHCHCRGGFHGRTCSLNVHHSAHYARMKYVRQAILKHQKLIRKEEDELGCLVSLLSTEESSPLVQCELCQGDKFVFPSGTYNFKLVNMKKSFKADCDMDTNQGRWLVFQRRQDGSVDFYQNYTEYENGFGQLGGEYWLGLKLLHKLTTAYEVEMRIDMEDWDGNKAYAAYSTFSVGSAASGYRLTVSGFSGNQGDSITGEHNLNGMRFTTFDRDQDAWDRNCAVSYKGAWWYNACHNSNLNGLYRRATVSQFADSINWNTWKGFYYSLKKTEMKLRIKSA